jgi:hypothetical protein
MGCGKLLMFPVSLRLTGGNNHFIVEAMIVINYIFDLKIQEIEKHYPELIFKH